MGVEVLDSTLDFGSEVEDTQETASVKSLDIDARRRLEDKLEEMRLRREVQEFDFDI